MSDIPSDLPTIPSTIMNAHMFGGNLSIIRDATMPPNSSPRSVMASTEEADPNDEPQKTVMTAHAVSVPATQFSSADKELLESGKWADAKIIANGKTYNVHKNVLCTRSKWFRKVLEGDFLEGQESVVKISAPDNIDRVLEFLYTGAVDLTNDTDLMKAANELSVLGDFYLSEQMHTYAAQVLGEYLGGYLHAICGVESCTELYADRITPEYWTFEWKSALQAGEPVNKSGPHRRMMIFKFLNENGFIDRLCAAIRDAYATPSGIHRVYVDFVYAARMHTFGSPLIRALREEVPEFGYDILSALMTGPLSSAFQGNKAFEQWKDGLANPEAVAAAKGADAHEDRQRDANTSSRDQNPNTRSRHPNPRDPYSAYNVWRFGGNWD